MKRRPKASRGRWFAGLGLTALAVGAVLWFFRETPATVPVVDASRLETSARRTLENGLANVRAGPKSGDAWGRFGAMLLAFDFPPEARQCFAEAERLDSRNARWPYFQSALLRAQDPAASLAALRRAVALCGNEPEMPRLRLARLLGEQGRWPEAKAELQALLSAKPDFAPATLLLAHHASAEHNDREAIELARRCTNDSRTTKAAWSLLATLYQRTGDAASAMDAARGAAGAREDEPIVDVFETEAAAWRESPREIALETHDLLAQGHLEAAASRIERLMRGHPQFPEGWLLLGRWQILRKEFPDAEKSLRHFLEMEPRSTQGLFQLGMALLNQNRLLEAAEVFHKATEIKSDFGPAHFNRGYALARAGKPREAVQHFREAIRHNPEHVESYLLLADLHRQFGEREEALKVLAEGLALSPDDTRLRQLKAQITSQPR